MQRVEYLVKNLLIFLFLLSASFVAQASEECDLPEHLCKAQQEYELADVKLNQVYQQIIRKIDSDDFKDGLVPKEEIRETLIQGQRVWLKYRDANCHAYYTLSSGGTSRDWDLLKCESKMTADRTKFLNEIYLEGKMIGEK
jgi:uncharacterized protein YecT (DUF1311 family)